MFPALCNENWPASVLLTAVNGYELAEGHDENNLNVMQMQNPFSGHHRPGILNDQRYWFSFIV